MKRLLSCILCPLAVAASALPAQSKGPASWLSFNFDEVRSTPTAKNLEGETVEVIHEVSAGGRKPGSYPIGGYHDLVDGVAGKALMFDGYSTRIAVPAEGAPGVEQGLHRRRIQLPGMLLPRHQR